MRYTICFQFNVFHFEHFVRDFPKSYEAYLSIYTRGLKHLPKELGCLLQEVVAIWQIYPLARITSRLALHPCSKGQIKLTQSRRVCRTRSTLTTPLCSSIVKNAVQLFTMSLWQPLSARRSSVTGGYFRGEPDREEIASRSVLFIRDAVSGSPRSAAI